MKVVYISNILDIANMPKEEKAKVTTVVLDKDITCIPPYTFYDFTSLENINLDHVVSIGEYAFCSEYLKEVNLSNAEHLDVQSFSICCVEKLIIDKALNDILFTEERNRSNIASFIYYFDKIEVFEFYMGTEEWVYDVSACHDANPNLHYIVPTPGDYEIINANLILYKK